MLNLGKGLKQHFLTAFDGWYRTKRFNYDWNTNQMSLGQIEEKRLRLEYGEIGTHCLSLSLSPCSPALELKRHEFWKSINPFLSVGGVKW